MRFRTAFTLFLLSAFSLHAQNPTPTQLVAQLVAGGVIGTDGYLRHLEWIGDVTISGVNYRGSGIAYRNNTPTFIGGQGNNCSKLIVGSGATSTEVKPMVLDLGTPSGSTILGSIKVTEVVGKPISVKTFILPSTMTLMVMDGTTGKYILTGRSADGKAAITLYLAKIKIHGSYESGYSPGW
jgi:hypothetical protein